MKDMGSTRNRQMQHEPGTSSITEIPFVCKRSVHWKSGRPGHKRSGKGGHIGGRKFSDRAASHGFFKGKHKCGQTAKDPIEREQLARALDRVGQLGLVKVSADNDKAYPRYTALSR